MDSLIGKSWGRACAALVLAGLLSACGGGGGGGGSPTPETPGSAQPGADYFPLNVDDRWYYVDGQGQTTFVRVMGTQAVSGGTAQVVRTQSNDDTVTELYLRDASGVLLVPGPGSDAITAALGPLQVLKLPLVAGDRWVMADRTLTDVVDLDGDGRPESVAVRVEAMVVGFETLTVGGSSIAGVARVQTTLSQSVRMTGNGQTVADTITSDDWYAPDLGPVRNRLSSGGITIESNLTGWRVGARRSETVAPTLVSRSPDIGAVVGGCCVSLSLGFSEVMDVDAGAVVELTGPDGKTVAGNLVWRPDGLSAGFMPVLPLAGGSYTVRVAAQDRLGNAMSPAANWQFSIDASAPAVTPVRPLPDAQEVALDTAIVFTLEADTDLSSVGTGTVLLSDGNGFVDVNVDVSGTTVTVTPKAALKMATRYQVLVSNIRDRFGNSGSAGWSFWTDPGRFAAAQPLVSGAEGITAAALGDIDGDGRVDIVLATGYDVNSAADSFKLRVLKGQADGSWAAPLTVDTVASYGADVYSLFVAELGGRKAVVLASWGQAIQILRPQSDGSLVSDQIINTPASYVVRLADIDGDGRLDLAGRPFIGSEVRVWLQQPDGRFGASQVVALESGGFGSLAVGDLNGDGRPDIVTLSSETLSGRQIGIALQQADGSFASARYLAPPGGGAVLGGAIGDVNGDGRADLVLALNASSSIVVLQQDAQGELVAGDPLAAAPSAMRVNLADVDGDGRLDVLSSSWGGWPLVVNRQRNDGSLGGVESFATGLYGNASPGLVAVGDVDADGRVDIVYGGALLKQRAVAATPPPAPTAAARQRLARVGRLPAR